LKQVDHHAFKLQDTGNLVLKNHLGLKNGFVEASAFEISSTNKLITSIELNMDTNFQIWAWALAASAAPKNAI
jgi:hypothetical protein